MTLKPWEHVTGLPEASRDWSSLPLAAFRFAVAVKCTVFGWQDFHARFEIPGEMNTTAHARAPCDPVEREIRFDQQPAGDLQPEVKEVVRR
ncbi:hypothetical protein J2794_006195 [Paraburkholderia terricola]|nr:hypothetical protein [Paraburkholderia terricola]MDR6450055.1 hypothetical protein [Paraburkholderia terricola]